MRLTYDPDVDAAYIYVAERIRDGEVHQTYPCEMAGIGGSIHLDFDVRGRLLGIEVLGAKTTLPPDVLSKAESLATPGGKIR